MIEIEFANVHYSFSNSIRPLYENLSFSVSREEIVRIHGISGAGKSTLLDLIAGFRRPQFGSVQICGMQPRVFVKENPGYIGLIPQFPHVMKASLRENIALGPPTRSDSEMHLIITEAGLGQWAKEFQITLDSEISDKTLSGGQKQRLALARILYQRPKLLLLDEPTSALDPANIEVSRSAISKLARECKSTGLIISHDSKLDAIVDRCIDVQK